MIGAAKRKNKAWQRAQNIVWYPNKGLVKYLDQKGWCPTHGMTDFLHKDIYAVFDNIADTLKALPSKGYHSSIWVCDLCLVLRTKQGRAF